VKRGRGFVILAIVAALALGVGGFYGWQLLQARRNNITLIAQFDNSAGLYPTNNVQVLGMKVGSVTKVTPKKGYVEVEFTVDKNVKIPADAQAVTLQTSILAERSVELTPGKGNGGLRTLIDSGAAIANGNGERMKSALTELSKALKLSADGGAETKEQLTKVVDNLSSLMDGAAANEGNLREFGSTVRVLSQVLADEDLGSGTTGKQLNVVLAQLSDLLEKNRDTIHSVVSNTSGIVTTTNAHARDLAEALDVAPMTLDNLYNIIDRENGAARAHILLDKVLFDSQTIKEMCNLMHLRQLGCSTGTLQDFGPDFGISYILDGLAAMGQK
jgi:ABC-type transporter Mla subunit MlaD